MRGGDQIKTLFNFLSALVVMYGLIVIPVEPITGSAALVYGFFYFKNA